MGGQVSQILLSYQSTINSRTPINIFTYYKTLPLMASLNVQLMCLCWKLTCGISPCTYTCTSLCSCKIGFHFVIYIHVFIWTCIKKCLFHIVASFTLSFKHAFATWFIKEKSWKLKKRRKKGCVRYLWVCRLFAP